MSIFNRLGGKIGDRIGNIGDRIGAVGKERAIILDVATLEKWPEQLLRHARVNEAMDTFLKDVERKSGKVHETKARLTDPRLKQKRFPERAYPIYDEHLPLIIKELEGVLHEAEFINDVFLIEEQQERFREAMASYHEQTRKSITALKEFLGQELSQLNQSVRDLEDAALRITPMLEQARFPSIKELKRLIEEYKATREKERKLITYRENLLKEIDALDAKKLKIKERIKSYAERARDPRYKELIAEEEGLLTQEEEITIKGLPEAEQEELLKPIEQRLAFIRKQMINDITALNINEQRTFLDAVKDDLLLARRKLERCDELLADLHFDTYRQKFATLVEPFKARIEDATQILDSEDEHVAPQ
jgi:hypothetical protein